MWKTQNINYNDLCNLLIDITTYSWPAEHLNIWTFTYIYIQSGTSKLTGHLLKQAYMVKNDDKPTKNYMQWCMKYKYSVAPPFSSWPSVASWPCCRQGFSSSRCHPSRCTRALTSWMASAFVALDTPVIIPQCFLGVKWKRRPFPFQIWIKSKNFGLNCRSEQVGLNLDFKKLEISDDD